MENTKLVVYSFTTDLTDLYSDKDLESLIKSPGAVGAPTGPIGDLLQNIISNEIFIEIVKNVTAAFVLEAIKRIYAKVKNMKPKASYSGDSGDIIIDNTVVITLKNNDIKIGSITVSNIDKLSEESMQNVLDLIKQINND